MTPAGSVRAQLGGEVAIPDAPVVWCAIEARTTAAGILRDLFGRPSMMTLELVTADGRRTTWRVSRVMLAGGFVISPAVTDADALSRLLSGHAAARVVRARLAGGDVAEPLVFRFSAVSQRP